MSDDPTEPETFGDDEVPELDEEVPEADAAEQYTPVNPDDTDDPLPRPGVGPVEEVNEADAAEQARVVHLDEDDYR
ncbi:hypothetical protein ACFWU3_03020 [Streptomyces sp. NPDC058685]|uniref:hypothetical protein n=1 Tax=Streptomyces sp. NPDC058685 TaxID=3346598 RepID=UPI00365481F8